MIYSFEGSPDMSTSLILHTYGYNPLILCYFLHFIDKTENLRGQKVKIMKLERTKFKNNTKNLGADIELSIGD